jgi:Uma2 family endonuclease
VKEYWLANPNLQIFEIYTLQNNRYELFAVLDTEDKLKSALLPDLEMDLKPIFEF